MVMIKVKMINTKPKIETENGIYFRTWMIMVYHCKI